MNSRTHLLVTCCLVLVAARDSAAEDDDITPLSLLETMPTPAALLSPSPAADDTRLILGCTDSAATNYSPGARQDDGNCVYSCAKLRTATGAPLGAICWIFANGQWPSELIEQATGDSITVPSNDAWIVQGRPLPGLSAQELSYRLSVEAAELVVRYTLVNPSSGGSQSGGSILASSSKLQLNNVIFGGLQAQNGGSLHLTGSTVTIANASFDLVSATSSGGAIWADNSVIAVSNSTFNQTTANRGGGAIYARSSNISITSTVFYGCTADDMTGGDAILMHHCDIAKILDTTFDPFDEERTVVFDTSWLKTMGGCAKTPCAAGFSCSYSEYSLACMRCPSGTIGDGLRCSSCGSGTGPTAQHIGCEKCVGNSYSKDGICTVCEPGTVVREDHASCRSCGNREDYAPGENTTSTCGCAAVRSAAPRGYYNVSYGLLVCFRDGFDTEEVANSRELYAIDETDARVCQKCPDCADCTGPVPILRPGYISDGPLIHPSTSPGGGERFAYLCDADTAITQEDEAKFQYLTSDLATRRCPGGSLLTPVCMQGYEGHFCQSCAVNYRKGSPDGHQPCVRCSQTQNVTVALRVAVFMTCVTVAIVGRKIFGKRDTNVQTGDFTTPLLAADPGFCSKLCLSDRLPSWNVLWAIVKMPIKIVITYAQVVGQLNAVLHVPFPNHFQTVMGHFSWASEVWDLMFSPDCVGLGGFAATWVLRCCAVPCCLGFIVFLLYLYDTCGSNSADAGQNSRQRLLFCMFFVYPTICNICFSAFLCRPFSPGSSVLVNDDRLRCEDPQISNVLQPLSFAIIISFAFGVPIVFAAIMFAKAKSHAESFQNLFEISSVHSSSQTLQEFQRACKTDASAAAAVLVHRDVTCLNEFAFMIESYRPDVTYWESLDMIRKLALVGIVVLVGRGSVAQIAFGSMLSFSFFALHVKVWPLKAYEDNLFRMTAELHVFWVITIAFVLKSDLTHENVKIEFYDTILVISFVLCIPCALVATVMTKLYRAQAAGILASRSNRLDSCKQAFARYELGLSSSSDRRVLREQFDAIQGQSTEQLRRSMSLLAGAE